jgi:hypothetical protein
LELRELAAWKSRNNLYVAGGNLASYWGDCLKAFPVPDLARWIDITGRLIKVGGGADLSGGDLPQYSLSSQQWREFLKAQVQHAIDIGADGFQIDAAAVATNNIAFGGEQAGSFDPFTMEAFRGYLAKRYSSAVLRSQFDISDIATFDYGAWIRQRGLPPGPEFAGGVRPGGARPGLRVERITRATGTDFLAE